MYFARNSFWSFSLSSFVAGLFMGTLPVAMAYIGDMCTCVKEKSERLGVIVGYYMLGNAGGGLFAPLLEKSGLFTPLILGAGFMCLSFIVNFFFFVESRHGRVTPEGKEEDHKRPEYLDNMTLWHIILGSLVDNIGSTAFFPLCLSPLAWEHYYLTFIDIGEHPIMTLKTFQWLNVCIALMVIPGTLITPAVFDRVGAAGGCVFGNLATALLTAALIIIGNANATTGMFALFITVMYLGFPLTVVSQLSTGPMLDIISPDDKIGYVQGLNNTIMNFGMAVPPWVFGLLADYLGSSTAIWIGVAISFLAVLVNWPLMLKPGMGPPTVGQELRIHFGEDVELMDHGESGRMHTKSSDDSGIITKDNTPIVMSHGTNISMVNRRIHSEKSGALSHDSVVTPVPSSATVLSPYTESMISMVQLRSNSGRKEGFGS